MDVTALAATANPVVDPGFGILAADRSVPTIERGFKSINVPFVCLSSLHTFFVARHIHIGARSHIRTVTQIIILWFKLERVDQRRNKGPSA